MKAVNLEGPPRAQRKEAVKDGRRQWEVLGLAACWISWLRVPMGHDQQGIHDIFYGQLDSFKRLPSVTWFQDGLELGRKFLAEGEVGC